MGAEKDSPAWMQADSNVTHSRDPRVVASGAERIPQAGAATAAANAAARTADAGSGGTLSTRLVGIGGSSRNDAP
jgi:hypothetical protein